MEVRVLSVAAGIAVWAGMLVVAGGAGLACGGAQHPAEHSAAASQKAAGHSCAPPAPAPPGGSQSAFAEPPAVDTVARCPVSGETFKVTAATARSEHQGRHYVFCCPGCKAKFDANPTKYAP